jgi:hypothetical protein
LILAVTTIAAGPTANYSVNLNPNVQQERKLKDVNSEFKLTKVLGHIILKENVPPPLGLFRCRGRP